MTDRFTFGIEEEYFLADARTGESPDPDAADRFHADPRHAGTSASHELLKGQVEVQTEPFDSLDAAHERLRGLRRSLADIADDHGLVLFAAGGHPLARARDQAISEKDRYRKLVEEFGVVTRRALFCAMHIHVAPPDPGRRIDLMNRMLPYLPLFLALSASSPFWKGHEAGMMAHRLTAFSEWPRMGLPEIFADGAEYERFVRLLVEAGAIEDASFLWWHIRPSARFPTIELRVCDSCTRLDDSIAIAALYRALMRCLSRRPEINAGAGPVERGVCLENIWQVQRRGLDAKLIDPRGGGAAPVATRIEETLALVRHDAEELGVAEWAERVREVLDRGTSADRQLAVWERALSDGADGVEAMREVVKELARETTM